MSDDTLSAEATIEKSVYERLAQSPTGRQWLLSTTVEAEEGDEGGIFQQLIESIDEPKLRRLAERHHADELRHAHLFRGCLERNGLEFQPLPDSLGLIRQIGERTGGFEGEHMTTQDMVATYALLYVIEQRGIERYPLIADAFDEVDPETAEIYRAVVRDEERHVRYCATIGRHYAENEQAWDELVEVCRQLETEAFHAVGAATLEHLASAELI